MYKIINNVKDELIINKSKFISFAIYISNVQMANEVLDKLKKEYKDATHICYAYKIGNIKRFNDDNEPKGTAGMPILNIIENKKLDNILIVVVRYFGGIKLGAGGLLRAYSNGASLVISDDNLTIIKKEYKVKIEFIYNNLNKINYILKDYNITYKEFDNNVIYEFIINDDNYPEEIDGLILKKEMCKL